MVRSSTDRLRGVGFLIAGLLTVALIGYLTVDPGVLADVHPIPLVLLLVFTALVAFWQANRLLR